MSVETRYSVLKSVETVVISPTITKVEQDGSDSKATIKTIDSNSLSLGTITPSETSPTKIIYLKVPSGIVINNIKIALVDSGGITFANNIFGIETHSHLDYNIIPSSYFEGINTDRLSTNEYNIDIPNNGTLESQYVYLNVTLPSNQPYGAGTIRYRWFFDFDSGVSNSTEEIINNGGIGSL